MFCDHVVWDGFPNTMRSHHHTNSGSSGNGNSNDKRSIGASDSTIDGDDDSTPRTPGLPSTFAHRRRGRGRDRNGNGNGDDDNDDNNDENDDGYAPRGGAVQSLTGHFMKGSASGTDHVTPTHFHYMLSQPVRWIIYRLRCLFSNCCMCVLFEK
jgi:hypothetical protein